MLAVLMFSSESDFTVYVLELSLDIKSSSPKGLLCVVFENQKIKSFKVSFGSVWLKTEKKKLKFACGCSGWVFESAVSKDDFYVFGFSPDAEDSPF